MVEEVAEGYHHTGVIFANETRPKNNSRKKKKRKKRNTIRIISIKERERGKQEKTDGSRKGRINNEGEKDNRRPFYKSEQYGQKRLTSLYRGNKKKKRRRRRRKKQNKKKKKEKQNKT